MNNNSQTEVVTIQVSDEEYQADLARGLEEDEVLRPGRHAFRRGAFLARHGLTTEQEVQSAKVRVTIDLDQDVFEFVTRRAAQAGDTSHESQINEVLRHAMREETGAYFTSSSSA